MLALRASTRRLQLFAKPTRALASQAAQSEFTLAIYTESSDFGFSRGSSYCLLTLRHSAFDGKDRAAVDALYEEKVKARHAYMDRLFAEFDRSGDSNLDQGELKEALKTAQLPASDARVKHLLAYHGSGAQVSSEQFRYVLDDVWGSSVSMEFRNDLVKHLGEQYAGSRAVVFVGRSLPTHGILRSVRHTWPRFVESARVLRRKGSEAPEQLDVFLDSYQPSVPESIGSVFKFLSAATKEGDEYVVELQGPDVGGEGVHEVSVPLRLVAQNAGGMAAARSGVDESMHTGRRLSSYVLAALVGGAIVLFIRGPEAQQRQEPSKSTGASR